MTNRERLLYLEVHQWRDSETSVYTGVCLRDRDIEHEKEKCMHECV